MTLTQFPKSKFWNFCWIFCPEMTLAQFPEFGFFVQNSRSGVNRVESWIGVNHYKLAVLSDFSIVVLSSRVPRQVWYDCIEDWFPTIVTDSVTYRSVAHRNRLYKYQHPQQYSSPMI